MATCLAGGFEIGELFKILQNPESPASVDGLEAGAKLPGKVKGAKDAPRLIGCAGLTFAAHYGSGDGQVLQLLRNQKDIFVFHFGCVVFWSVDRVDTAEKEEVIKALRRFMTRPLDMTKGPNEDEVMGYYQPKARDLEELDEVEEDEVKVSFFKSDAIQLRTQNAKEKLAHSYALAQSVRLSIYENQIDESIGNSRSIPEAMAERGNVEVTSIQLSQQMGRLFVLRCDVNLHTDILDTPDIFWDEEQFEPHYLAGREYFDIDKRVHILNHRLDVLKDLYELLQNSLNVKHGNKLEWIVIILILVEVFLELLEIVTENWGRLSMSFVNS